MGSRLRVHEYEIRHFSHRNKYFIRAVQANPEAFEFCVIEWVDQSELLKKEQFWMDFYKSYIPANGYNVCAKAGSCAGIKQSPERIEKTASKIRGRKHPPRSAEWLHNMSVAQKGKPKTYLFKPVIQMDMNGNDIKRFASITEAAKSTGLQHSGIMQVLKSAYKQTGGFKWKYAE